MFTGIIKLAQIDDYISPSQNCIQPKILHKSKQQKATVTLNDCLACSGCITSAETLLIEQMSVAKLMSSIDKFKKVETKDKQHCIVFIISPQSLISLSKYYSKSPTNMFHLIQFILKKYYYTNFVYELAEGIKLVHQLMYEEFMNNQKKTLICSQCPGWICYAEKTLERNVTQCMSKIKSPQQVISRLIKQKYGESETFIVTVMPCYDKKLEAIRFDIEKEVSKEVDLTIATTEFRDMIQSHMHCFEQSQDMLDREDYQPIDRFFTDNLHLPLTFLQDQASNGYIHNLIHKLSVKPEDVKVLQIKNSDFLEYQVIVSKLNQSQTKQQVLFKFAKCYGFRNIQKVIQNIKKKKYQYKYIEIMACPGGCFNGGGQIKFQGSKSKETILEFNAICQKSNESMSKETKNEDKKQNESIMENYIKELKQKEKFMAEYKPIEKTLTQSVMNW